MRRLAALCPESAPLDERTPADGLVFASKFSRLVNFFNRDDRVDGDWSAFFDEEPIVQYALIDRLDMAELAEYYAEVLEQLLAGEHEARAADATGDPPDNAAPAGAEPPLGLPVALECLRAILCRANAWHRFFGQRTDEKVFFDAVDAAIRRKRATEFPTAPPPFIGKRIGYGDK